MLPSDETPSFVHTAHGRDGAKHSIGVTASGDVYTWGGNNTMGQLGRDKGRRSQPHIISLSSENSIKAVRGYVGGVSESGHSAFVDETRTRLYVAGCDRWQQLGLGSAKGGASGYTWTDGGRIWHNQFIYNKHLHECMKEHSGDDVSIRDVALGGDHTIVLADNKSDVYAFGKGGEGQLGTMGKPFVSAPVRSTQLSDKNGKSIAAVCAIQHCSLTLDDSGCVLKTAGKCRMTQSIKESLQACVRRAEKDGLLQAENSN